MESITPFLQYGAFGLLAIVLVGAYLLAGKFVQRMNDSTKFTEELTRSSIDRINELADKGVKAQVSLAETMTALTESIRNGHGDSKAHYTQMISDHTRIMSKLDKPSGGS